MKIAKRVTRMAFIVVLALLIQLFSGVSFPKIEVRALEPLEDMSIFGRLLSDEILELGHKRVTDRYMEKMNMIEYENEDGTYTTYLFSQPIKYLDVDTNTIRYIKGEEDRTVLEKRFDVISASADPVSCLSVQDAEVSSYSPTVNCSTGDTLGVGKNAASNAEFEIYVKFDLSAIQGTICYDQVVSACYAMYQETYYTKGQPFNMGCYRISQNWNADTITWNTKPSCDSSHLSVESIYHTTDTNTTDTRRKYHYFMITNLAQGWLQGVPNYGIAFKYVSGADDTRSFASTESIFTTKTPFFRITYTATASNVDNVGIKDGSTYYIKQNGLYLDATNYQLQKREFTGASSQQWTVYTTEDGYFYLLPEYDPCMGLTYTGTTIGLDMMDTTAPFEFKFTRNWNGTYHIVTRTYPTKGLGSPSPTGTGISLRTLTTSLTNYDDWTLEAVGEDRSYWVMSNEIASDDYSIEWIRDGIVSENEIDDPSICTLIGNAGWNNSLQTANSATTAARLLATSNFCVLHAHSGPGCMNFSGSSSMQWLSADSTILPQGQYSYGINALSANSLAAARVVLLAACSAGNDADSSTHETDETTEEVYNLASAIYRKGAHLVISFVNPAAAQAWYPTFFAQCAAGVTVAEAMVAADAYVLARDQSGDLGNMLNRHVLGDTSLRLKVYD